MCDTMSGSGEILISGAVYVRFAIKLSVRVKIAVLGESLGGSLVNFFLQGGWIFTGAGKILLYRGG